MEKLIVPNARHANDEYEDALRNSILHRGAWLDVGAGHQALPTWRFKQEQDLVQRCKMAVALDFNLGGLREHRSIGLRVAGDVAQMPFEEGSFDLVSANMVVEHMERPEASYREIFRVLRPGGVFVFHTPNARSYQTLFARLIPGSIKKRLVWLLEGRKEEEVFETHYKANTQTQITWLAKLAGFRIVKIEMTNAGAELALVPFLAFFELLLIRLLMTRFGSPFRTNIVAVLMRCP